MKINSYANNSGNEIYSPQQAPASNQAPQGNRHDSGAESNGPAQFQSGNNNLNTDGNQRFKRAGESSEEEFSANDVHHIKKKENRDPNDSFAKDFRSQFADQEYQVSSRYSPPRPAGWNAQRLAEEDERLRNNGYEFVGYVGQSTPAAISTLRNGFGTGEPNTSEDRESTWSGQFLSTDPEVAVGYAGDQTGERPSAGAILRVYAPSNLVASTFYRTPDYLDDGNPSRYFGDRQPLAGRSLTGPQNAGNPEPETVVDRSITGELLTIPSLYEPDVQSGRLANPGAEENIPGLNSAPPNYRELPSFDSRKNGTSDEPVDNTLTPLPAPFLGAYYSGHHEL